MSAPCRSVTLQAVAAIVLVVVAAAPVGAQPDDAIAEALTWIGVPGSEAAAATDDAAADLPGDTFRYAVPGAAPATLDLAHGDITRHVAMAAIVAGFGPDRVETVPCGQVADGSLVLCDTPVVALGGGFWVFTMEVGGEIPWDDTGRYHSLAVAVLTRDGTPWEAQGDFLWDTFQGTDLWFRVERSPGVDWRLTATSSTGFTVVPTGSFAVIRGRTLTVAVPGAALGFPVETTAGTAAAPFPVAHASMAGLAGLLVAQPAAGSMPCYGVASHIHSGGFGASPTEPSIVDAAPDTNTEAPRTPGDLAKPRPGIVILGAPPPVTTTTTDASTTTPATQPPAGDPAPAGGLDPRLLGGILGGLVLVGVLVGPRLAGTRSRGAGPGTRPRDDDDPRDAPGPEIYGEEVGYDRYSYRLELRYWRAWTEVFAFLSTLDPPDPLTPAELEKGPWAGSYDAMAETYLVVRGEFVEVPGVEQSLEVVRIGSTEDKAAKKYSSRFRLLVDPAVSPGDRAGFIARFRDAQEEWRRADPPLLTARMRSAQEYDRWVDRSHVAQKRSSGPEYHRLAAGAGWPLAGGPVARRMRFKVLAAWTVATSEVAESQWTKYTDTLAGLVADELLGRAEGAVKGIGGRAGDLAVQAAKKVAADAKLVDQALVKLGLKKDALSGARVIAWSHLPKGWLPVLGVAPTSDENAPFGSGSEAWARARSAADPRILLGEHRDGATLRWRVFLDQTDARLHVDETYHPGSPVPKTM